MTLTALNATLCGSAAGAALWAVIEKLSIARPSSEPVASWSTQRIQKVAPAGMLRLEMTDAMLATRLAARLPSREVAEPVVTGGEKSSALTSIQVPVVR